MKFSTEAVEKMAETLVQEMNKLGVDGQGIREVERTMRALVREVGVQALGKYLEQQDEQLQEQEVICPCGEAMPYLCKRPATIVSVFGRVSYRRGYYLCQEGHARQSPLDRRIGVEAGQVTAGLAELLALAGVEIAFEEATRWLEHYLLFRASDNTLRKETERFGELQEVQETEWTEKSQEEAWPHDGALIAAGFRRYGFDGYAQRLLKGIVEASMNFRDYRLPELFAGFSREEYNVPVHYPVACHPQAWAAGSIPYLINSFLGLEPAAFEGQLRIRQPILPDFVDRMWVRQLRIGHARVDMYFEHRPGGGTKVDVLKVDGKLDIIQC